MLTEYRKWSPTPLDAAGAFLDDDDRGGWLVCPCSHTRDSDCLTESNWERQAASLAVADPAGDDHEAHTFGHWGPGWVEIVIVRPGSAAAAVAADLAARLGDYPVLDEADYSRREWEQYGGHWDDGDAVRELARLLRRGRLLSPAAADRLGDADPATVREWFEARMTSGDYYDPESGCYPRLSYAVDGLGRDGGRRSLANLMRVVRATTRVPGEGSVP